MPPQDDIELDGLDDVQPTEGETTEPTPEERIAALEAENAKFAAFKPLLEQLDEDPSKIYDMRAALAGRAPAGDKPVEPAQEQLNPEQLKNLNTQITDAILEGRGLDAIAAVSDKIAENRMAALQRETEPLVAMQADAFVDAFRSRKEKSTPAGLYAAVESEFERECSDLDRRALMREKPEARARELDRRWNAAAGSVLLKKVKSSSAHVGSAGLGGSGMGSGGRAPDSPIGERERRVMERAGMSAAEINDFAKELQQGA